MARTPQKESNLVAISDIVVPAQVAKNEGMDRMECALGPGAPDVDNVGYETTPMEIMVEHFEETRECKDVRACFV